MIVIEAAVDDACANLEHRMSTSAESPRPSVCVLLRPLIHPGSEEFTELPHALDSDAFIRVVPVAQLCKAEHTLDDPDAVLELGANAGLAAVLPPRHFIDTSPVPGAAIDEVIALRRMLEYIA